MRHFSFIIIFSALLLPLPFFVHAQLQALDNNSSGILISTEPSDPGPNEYVTVTVESYATDLNRAEISWFINGVLDKKAVGLKTFLFKAGGLGSISNILAVIVTSEGETLQKVLTINPSNLDILWEAQSYTPPFFKGKASYPFEGLVKLVAMPRISDENGVIVNPKTLVYTWKINGDPVPTLSGYGRNFMFLEGTLPIKSTVVSVKASTLDKKFTATNSVTVTPSGSETIFYEDSPTLGVLYNKALGKYVTLGDQEIRIASVPYFIGVKTREDSGLKYEWKLNDQIVNGENTSSLSFKQTAGVTGSSLVGIQISNSNKIFQFANNSLSINFGSPVSASPF